MQGTNQPHSTDEPRQGHPHQENLDLLNHPEMYLNLLSNKIKRRKADSELSRIYFAVLALSVLSA